MNLSVKHLRAFTELATERNFTRAAENCHLSQPAFSTLIRNLEEQTGARLFNRNTRSVELTDDGRVFEARVGPLLADFELAFSDIRSRVQQRKGRLAIAALPSVAGGALPAVMARFAGENPGVKIVLRDVTADSCLELVRERLADFALSAVISPGPDMHSEPLASDTFHLVCRDDHPLASRGRLDLKDILALPLIRFDRRSSVRQHLDAAFYPHQAVTALEVSHLMTAAGLVAAGIAVTLVPTLALFQFQLPRLVTVPVTLPIKDRDICLIRRSDSTDSAAAAAFIALLKQMWKVGNRRRRAVNPPARRR